MTYRLLADENVERATISDLPKLGHDVESVGSTDDLGLGATDEAIASYARTHDRVILGRRATVAVLVFWIIVPSVSIRRTVRRLSYSNSSGATTIATSRNDVFAGETASQAS